MEKTTAEQAGEAIAAVDRAQRQVAAEVGLPRIYWWGMAAGWLALGLIDQFGPAWLTVVGTLGFGMGHSAFAARLLGGRRRTDRLQVSAAVAGRRVPFVVVGMLLGLVGVTILAAMTLKADGAGHPTLWAAALTAAVTGFGGPEILRALLRWSRA
ncbi:hypothetical protein AN217_24980 [Streptomyces qinglanensis]|uniref:Transmembrane protein n=1 Tax=Streptomyces qinglanensis TaxID=943816 RepID=A0A1E7K9B2_9ACTN|nr:hypothetical protein [Streptomyces qinglanensis]OEV00520.1 hypothetical protein AN217_24980 [Streptomyces qinglanensis]OEV25796.1 hypothetical protein AN220_11790 [Streptomyces nanshensis]